MSKRSFSVVDDTRHPLLTIIALAWPIFVEQILVSLVHSIDTAMVGSLGAEATASVAISQSPNMLINGVVMSLGVGYTSLVSRRIGARDIEGARRLLRQAILTIFAVGIPMSALLFGLARLIPAWMGGAPEILDTAATYNRILALSMLFRSMTMVLAAIYRGYGDSKTPMKINVMVNLLNMVGNFLMIYPTREIEIFGLRFTMFGCGWGVAGAAVATSLSASIGGILLLVLCFTRKSEMQISLKESFAPDWKEISGVVRIGLPAMLERFTMSSASVIVSSTVASLGTIAVAAQNLAGTAESLSFMPGFAFGSAATTLFGQSIGAKRPDLGKKYVSLTIRMGAVVMLLTSLMLFFAGKFIMSLFTPDAAVIDAGADLLKVLALIQIPQMIAMVYSGALRGAGDTKSPFYIALISMWGVRVTGVLLCTRVFHLGLTAVCISMCIDNVVRFLLFTMRYKKESWKKKTV